jgi:hypothetical protein
MPDRATGRYRAGGPSGRAEDRRQPPPQLRHRATRGEFAAPASPLASSLLLTQTLTSLLICVRPLGVASLLGSLVASHPSTAHGRMGQAAVNL